MDYILRLLDERTGALITPPHGTQSRFHTEAEAVTRAEELRGEAAALGDTRLPGFAVVMESTGETVREIKDAAHATYQCVHGAKGEAGDAVELICHSCALDLIVTLRADITALEEENSALREGSGREGV